MPVDSLLEIARRACCRYSRRIDDVGDLSYKIVRPILLKIENPDQLHRIEHNCPQIVGEDEEIWLSMIKRDIPNWETKPHKPSNPKNWYKAYRKLKQDAQKEMAAGEAKLKAALSSLNNRKEENTAQVVTARSLPPPRVSRQRQVNYSYTSGRASCQGGHKMSVLDKFRKEGRDARSAKMNRPMHTLGQRSMGVKKAPAGFVEDLRRQNQTKSQFLAPENSHMRPIASRPLVNGSSDSTYNLNQDREARLRALKAGKNPTVGNNQVSNRTSNTNSGSEIGLSAQFLEDDDLDDDSDDGFDDGFVGKPQMAKASPGPVGTPPRIVKRKLPPQVFTAAHSPKKRT